MCHALALARLRASRVVHVFSVIARNPDLLRLQLALFGFNMSEWAVWVAVMVYAYDRGGATEAGIVAVIQLVPAGLCGPVISVLADREPPARLLKRGYLVQSGLLTLVAVVLVGGGPRYLVYFVSALAATAMTTTRPAQTALVPYLARRPEELTATNVVSGWNESVAMLAAPAFAGALLATVGPGWVFAVMAAATLVSALLVAALDRPRDRLEIDPADAEASSGVLADVVDGIRVVAGERSARMLVLLLGIQFLALGALDLLTVVVALSVLDLGQGGSGFLNAAFGAGAVLATLLTARFVGSRRLIPWLIAAAVGWGGALLVLGVRPSKAAAVALLIVAGVSYMLFQVAGRTLLQRAAPADVVSRVFGLVEGIYMFGLAAGALIVPLLVSSLGVKAAVIGTGAVLPISLLLCGRALLDVDADATVPVVEIALLRSVPFLESLPAPELETLARSLVEVDAEPGEVLIAEGEVGDRFYVVAEGEVEATRGGEPVHRFGRGDGFGEIALLQDVPRTATCTAIGPATLYALDREPFVLAVCGHRRSLDAASRIVEERLAGVAPAAPATEG
jgi:CRP-like cAMP-binding protein